MRSRAFSRDSRPGRLPGMRCHTPGMCVQVKTHKHTSSGHYRTTSPQVPRLSYRYISPLTSCNRSKEGRKEKFCLTMHSTHIIYSFVASDMLNDHSDSDQKLAVITTTWVTLSDWGGGGVGEWWGGGGGWGGVGG